LLADESIERPGIEAVMGDVPHARPERRPGVPLGLAAADPDPPRTD
jgi:hypothetical protein